MRALGQNTLTFLRIVKVDFRWQEQRMSHLLCTATRAGRAEPGLLLTTSCSGIPNRYRDQGLADFLWPCQVRGVPGGRLRSVVIDV